MFRGLNTPSYRMVSVFVTGILLIVLAVKLAIQQPEIDATLEVGTVIESDQGRLVLDKIDFILEPGEIENHENLDQFYERQNKLAAIITGKDGHLTKKNETTILRSQKRSVSDLPLLFWIQVLVGFSALVISGCIWALRSSDLAAHFFAFSGLSVFVSAITSAIYTTRASAIPAPLFRILEEANAVGAALFGISMLGLFLIYPVRLLNWKRWIWVPSVFFGGWTILFLLKWTPEWAGISPIIVAEMVSLLFLIGVQFFATKKDPKARASLTWLGLSVLTGAGAFVAFNTAPLILKLTPLNQGYAFLFFLIIYLGLAAGLTRFRLFEVGQWVFRFLFYTAGTLFFVFLDAGLVFVLGMDRFPALGLALLATGFLYLPMRDVLWRYFSRQKRMESHELVQEALHVALAPAATLRAARWESLLRRIFDPLQIEPAGSSIDHVEILSDGLVLVIPPVMTMPPLKLSYPWAGSSLYSLESLALTNQVVSLINQIESNREAYDRGVIEERRRMAQDLHDDLGAKLLSGLHIADNKTRPAFEAALDEMKSIVNEMSGERIPLSRLIADVRHETLRRISNAKIKLDWPIFEDEESEHILDYPHQKVIKSSIRETVSNVIRHSQATELKIRIHAEIDSLYLIIQDNGRGFPPLALNSETKGRGVENIKRRVLSLGGTIQFNSESGCSINIFIPFRNRQTPPPNGG